MKNSYFIILILILQSILVSQAKINIEQIEVKGNIRLSENDILRISRLKVGSSIDMEDIQNAVKNLSKLNQFNDIQIFLKDQNPLSDGVNLKIIVDEHPLLRKLEIRGNKKLKDSKIIELMELSEGTLLSKIKIFSAKKNIIDEYEKKHFHNVKIDTLIRLTENKDFADLTIIMVYLYKILDKVYDIQYFIFQSLTNSFNKSMDFLILNC